MITISDDGKLNISVFATPTFKMGSNAILLTLTKVKSVHYETGLVEVSREDEYRKIEFDDSTKIDPTTMTIVLPDAEGNYPSGSVGVFEHIASLALSDLGEPQDNAMQKIGQMVESVLVANNKV